MNFHDDNDILLHISHSSLLKIYILTETKVISRYSKDGKTSFTYVPLRIISFLGCANILYTPRNLAWWQQAL